MDGRDCRTLYLTVIVLTYLVAGAVIMMKLERPVELEARELLLQKRNTFLLNNECITGKNIKFIVLFDWMWRFISYKLLVKCTILTSHHLFATWYA